MIIVFTSGCVTPGARITTTTTWRYYHIQQRILHVLIAKEKKRKKLLPKIRHYDNKDV